MNKKIGLLDSGIGGTTILKEIKQILPKEDYIYYADSKNNPYGEKTEEEIYTIVKEITEVLIKKDCKLIVLACNTATTRCMKKLKRDFTNILFVGTVPAIKVACNNNYKNTLVLATPATIDSERTQELIQENKKEDQNIILMPCEGLANAIETNDTTKITKILTKIKDSVPSPIDSIILGCTHYPLIKKEIQKLFPKSTLLDGSIGVAKEVKRLLQENKLLAENGQGQIEYIISKARN